MTFTSAVVFDDSLTDWALLADEKWTGILVGNGASIAVWSKFKYESLYEEARAAGQLGADAVAIFQGFGTLNFEEVLSRLRTTIQVKGLLGQSTFIEEDLHEEVRIASISAVQRVHVLHRDVPDTVRDAIKDALLHYDFVYSTNYDLLLYWAIQRDIERFNDMFRTRNGQLVFVPDSEVRESHCLLYLHGALHLFRDDAEITHKDANEDGEDLLTRFETKRNWSTTTPLFVTEGSAADKLRAIRGSEYLNYAYGRLSNHEGQMVIFGCSLSDVDDHLSSRIKAWLKCRMAVSVRPNDPNIKDTKARARRALGWQHDLQFFDSTTHPLGSSSLRVG